jgi:hypothetical protein
MTVDATETHSSAPEGPKRSARRWWLVMAIAIVLAALVGGAIAAHGSDSNDDAALGTRQLTSIRQACTTWQVGDTGTAAPAASWCGDMVGWMTGQIRGGHMMGSMMWGNPDEMRSTCQAWLSSGQGADTAAPNASAWCDQMVDWMTQHMGQWDQWDRGWMMDGPMMGR